MRLSIACAALFHIAPQLALAQDGAPYCLRKETGAVSCTFATMGDCEKARPSASADQCITRSDTHGTTGLGEKPDTPPVKYPDALGPRTDQPRA